MGQNQLIVFLIDKLQGSGRIGRDYSCHVVGKQFIDVELYYYIDDNNKRCCCYPCYLPCFCCHGQGAKPSIHQSSSPMDRSVEWTELFNKAISCHLSYSDNYLNNRFKRIIMDKVFFWTNGITVVSEIIQTKNNGSVPIAKRDLVT